MVLARSHISFRSLVEVGKLRIAVASACSTIPGFLLHEVHWNGSVLRAFLAVLVGTMILAAGAGALNNVQDIRLDERSARTRGRALPSGRLQEAQALMFSLSLLMLGMVILLRGASADTAMLGLAAVVMYNGIYTPLKRLSPLALWPGTVVGALPPLMGNAAANGSWSDPGIYWLAAFYMMWQVPHFMLILLKHGTSYSDWKIPTLLDWFSTAALARLAFLWIVGVAAFAILGMLFLPRAGMVSLGLLVMGSIWVLRPALALLLSPLPDSAARHAFLHINVFSLLVAAVVALQL